MQQINLSTFNFDRIFSVFLQFLYGGDQNRNINHFNYFEKKKVAFWSMKTAHNHDNVIVL